VPDQPALAASQPFTAPNDLPTTERWHRHGGSAPHLHERAAEHGHDHSHDVEVFDARTLWSVGIDVGSSTTHMTVSQLVVGRPNNVVHRKPEVLERRLVYRSPITFTPFRDDVTIDAAAIQRLVDEGYGAVGIDAAQIDAGAVICTGLAALKENAAAITERLAADSGRFVCATAGHHFEALLAARGSGSVALSRRVDGLVANLDVGGGTTKLTLARDGEIVQTAALAVGARLLVLNDQGGVARIEPSAHPLLAAAGVEATSGAPLAPEAQARLAALMAAAICAFAGLSPRDSSDPCPTVEPELVTSLLLTDAPLTMASPPPGSSQPPYAAGAVPGAAASPAAGGRKTRPSEHPAIGDQAASSPDSPHYWGAGGAVPAWLICSGGVSEYVYGWQTAGCGDLGQALGTALRAALDARPPAGRLLEPAEGIRATVIGACQYSMQVSGDTVYLSDAGLLPIHNVPALPVALDWEALSAEAVTAAAKRALQRAEPDAACALALRGPRRFGYGLVDTLARGLAAALEDRPADAPLVLAFDQDLANTVGRALAARLAGRVSLLCVDELALGELDYLDLGKPPPGESYVPVVVKSLVFAG
jgi:ethanolamine utilization protein EutA